MGRPGLGGWQLCGQPLRPLFPEEAGSPGLGARCSQRVLLLHPASRGGPGLLFGSSPAPWSYPHPSTHPAPCCGVVLPVAWAGTTSPEPASWVAGPCAPELRTNASRCPSWRPGEPTVDSHPASPPPRDPRQLPPLSDPRSFVCTCQVVETHHVSGLGTVPGAREMGSQCPPRWYLRPRRAASTQARPGLDRPPGGPVPLQAWGRHRNLTGELSPQL